MQVLKTVSIPVGWYVAVEVTADENMSDDELIAVVLEKVKLESLIVVDHHAGNTGVKVVSTDQHMCEGTLDPRVEVSEAQVNHDDDEYKTWCISEAAKSGDYYATKAALVQDAVEWDGEDIDSITYHFSCHEDLAGHLANPNPDAERFSHAAKQEWPDDNDYWNAYRAFYCAETEEFGTYFMTREAYAKRSQGLPPVNDAESFTLHACVDFEVPMATQKMLLMEPEAEGGRRRG